MTTDTDTRPVVATHDPAPATTTSPAPEAGDTIWHTYRDTRAPDLRNDLLLRYQHLVRIVVARLRTNLPPTHDAADLISDGIFGLLDAIEKYDPDRGVQFQTYASTRIRGAVIDAIRGQDWVPRTVRDRKRHLDNAAAAAGHRLGRTPTSAEIADEAGITLDELHRIRRRPSLHIGVTDDDIDTATDHTPNLTGWGSTVDPTTHIALTTALRTLSTRDQQVIALYFFDGLTLAEIGTILGVTEGRVSQLRSRALKALRTALTD